MAGEWKDDGFGVEAVFNRDYAYPRVVDLRPDDDEDRVGIRDWIAETLGDLNWEVFDTPTDAEDFAFSGAHPIEWRVDGHGEEAELWLRFKP